MANVRMEPTRVRLLLQQMTVSINSISAEPAMKWREVMYKVKYLRQPGEKPARPDTNESELNVCAVHATQTTVCHTRFCLLCVLWSAWSGMLAAGYCVVITSISYSTTCCRCTHAKCTGMPCWWLSIRKLCDRAACTAVIWIGSPHSTAHSISKCFGY